MSLLSKFNVEADLGLQGYCNFLLSFSYEQYFITAPVITIVEEIVTFFYQMFEGTATRICTI